MNFAALVLRISKVTERFPRFHKIARRAYCVFRPGIRFQTEAAFKDYQDIFVLKIDLLNIDCEGFDYVILRQFDFTTLRPRIVLFEQKHLTAQDRQAAKIMMERAGYKVEEMETDVFCLAEP